MGGHNGYGTGNVPLIKRKSDWVCSLCGTRAELADTGEPESLIVNRKVGEKSYHCMVCLADYQQSVMQQAQFVVPKLEFKPVDAPILALRGGRA